MDGFSGKRAYDYRGETGGISDRVRLGPTRSVNCRPICSDQLHGFGCNVDVDDFHAYTPEGSIAMKNIVAKIPGTGPKLFC